MFVRGKKQLAKVFLQHKRTTTSRVNSAQHHRVCNIIVCHAAAAAEVVVMTTGCGRLSSVSEIALEGRPTHTHTQTDR